MSASFSLRRRRACCGSLSRRGGRSCQVGIHDDEVGVGAGHKVPLFEAEEGGRAGGHPLDSLQREDLLVEQVGECHGQRGPGRSRRKGPGPCRATSPRSREGVVGRDRVDGSSASLARRAWRSLSARRGGSSSSRRCSPGCPCPGGRSDGRGFRRDSIRSSLPSECRDRRGVETCAMWSRAPVLGERDVARLTFRRPGRAFFSAEGLHGRSSVGHIRSSQRRCEQAQVLGVLERAAQRPAFITGRPSSDSAAARAARARLVSFASGRA